MTIMTPMRTLLLLCLVVAVSSAKLPVVINTWGFTHATQTGWETLASTGDVLSTVERGCAQCEVDQCDTTVGWGGSPDETGETTLDAMIMDGTTMDAGSVGCLRRVRNAIAVARQVMERTYHTLLVGDLATKFAIECGFEEQTLSSVYSVNAYESWYKLPKDKRPSYRKPDPSVSENDVRVMYGHDTIGMIAVNSTGHFACGTSTNGAAHKVPGRVGDSPIIGSGAYCDSAAGGAAATGDGDQMMRFLPAFMAVQLMKMGLPVNEACNRGLAPIMEKFPNAAAAIVCVDKYGNVTAAATKASLPFPYSYRNPETDEVVVAEIYDPPSPTHQRALF